MRMAPARYWGGTAILVSLALVLVLPQLIAPYVIPSYRGIGPMEMDNEAHYFARIMSAGARGIVGNPFIADAHTDIVPSLITVEAILALPLRWFTLDVQYWNIILRLFAAIALAFTLYRFLKSFLEQRAWSLFGTAWLLIGSSLLIEYHQIIPFLSGAGHMGFLHYGRFINPMVSGAFFYIFVYALYRHVRSTRSSNADLGVLALSFGALLYVYMYFWLFALVLFICIGIYYVAIRSSKIWSWLAAGSIALGIDLYYILSYFSQRSDPFYSLALERGATLIPSFAPSIGGSLIIFSVTWVCMTVLMRRSLRAALSPDHGAEIDRWVFMTAFLASSWLLLNQQIISGKALQTGHFHWYMVAPGACLALLTVLRLVIRPAWELRAKYLLILGSVGLVLIGGAVQYKALQSVSSVLAERQDIASALRWLAAHGTAGDVVFANQEDANLIPVYTDKRVWYANSVVTYPIDPRRIWEGRLMWWRLQGISLPEVAERLKSDPAFMQTLHESHVFRTIQQHDPGRLEREYAELLSAYESFLAEPADAILDSGSTRYLLIDTRLSSGTSIIGVRDRLVYGDERYRIYERLRED